MPRRSNIEPAIVTEIERLRKDEGLTIDQIIARLQNTDIDVPSRSSVGRVTQKMDQMLQVHRSAVQMSRALGKQLGANENDLTRGLAEVLSMQLMQIGATDELTNITDNAAAIKVLQQMSKALHDIAKAQHYDVNTIARIREEAKKAALDEAKKAVQKTAQKQGLSEEAAAEFMNLLGG